MTSLMIENVEIFLIEMSFFKKAHIDEYINMIK